MKGIKLIMDTKIIEKINYLSDKIYGTKYNWHSKGNRIQWIDNNENLKDLTQDLWAIKNGIVLLYPVLRTPKNYIKIADISDGGSDNILQHENNP